MRNLLLSLFFLGLLFFSCQQELDDLIPEIQQRCRIVTAHYYGGSGITNDSTQFIYEGNRISRAETSDGHVSYTYTGDNITGRKFYLDPGNQLYAIDTIRYDVTNRITQMISWHMDDPWYYDTTKVVLNFQYNNGKIERVTEIISIFSPFGLEVDTAINIFHTNAAGNIDKMWIADNQGIYDSITYTFNSHPNYFSVMHPHFFIFDPDFQLHAGLTPHFAYFYSKNNVVSFIIYDNWEYNITYGLDSLNNVTSIDMSGDEYMKYRYQCQ